MIAAMLGTAVEAFLVRPFMGPAGPMMKLTVPRVIASMPLIVVMGEGRRSRDTQRQDGSCQKHFANGHSMASLADCPARKLRQHSPSVDLIATNLNAVETLCSPAV